MPRRDLGIVACVPDRWSDYWQVRHQVVSRLASKMPVVWIDPTPGGTPGSVRTVIRPSEVDDLWISRAGLLDSVLRRSPRRFYARYRSRVRQAIAFLENAGCARVALYIWRPDFSCALDVAADRAVVYHIDDEYAFSEEQTPISGKEKRLLETADVSIIHSRRLYEQKSIHARRAVRIPNGVDFDAYNTRRPCPADLDAIPRPIIGYSGFLKLQMDWSLINHVSGAIDGASFVFVGPKRAQGGLDKLIASLEKRPNVYFLGGKPHDELPGYVQHFDIAMMPYEVNAYTNCIYPLKMHEYMAAGVPVVSSAIDAVREFDDLITVATGEQAWTRALSSLLADNAELERLGASAKATARSFDWDIIAGRVAATFDATRAAAH